MVSQPPKPRAERFPVMDHNLPLAQRFHNKAKRRARSKFANGPQDWAAQGYVARAKTARHQSVLRKWLHGCRLVMEPFGCKRLSTSDESSCSRVENLVLAGLAFSQSAASGTTTLSPQIAARCWVSHLAISRAICESGIRQFVMRIQNTRG